MNHESESKDTVTALYEGDEAGYLLARTFRSGENAGVKNELAYLENKQGYVFVNPTTLISAKYPVRTISQTPENDWSYQPSLLFAIQAGQATSIAHYGLASLNSFSSTKAMKLMQQFSELEGKAQKN